MKKIVAWTLAGTMAVVIAASCAGSGTPECKVGSLKTEHGKIYHCKDNGNGPRWVKE